jgi:glycosyltransferase involved in cell wall biosynthesis
MYPFTMGGPEKRYWEIARRLYKKHEIHFVTARNTDSNSSTVAELAELAPKMLIHYVASFRSVYREDGRRSFYSALKFSSKIVPSLASCKFDVIDATFAPIIHIYPLKIVSRYTRSSLIYTVHEVWSEYWSEYLASRLMGNLAKYLEWIAMRLADRIIVVSETSARQCVELNIPREKIAVVPNGIDTKYINEVELSSSEYDSDVVFVGRLVPYKGIELLLGAAKLLKGKFRKDPRIHIIGTGPLKEHLLSLVREFGLSSSVRLLDKVNDYQELIRYLKGSKVFVLPSFREGFSIATIEAMASGLPVITFDVESNIAREHVKDFVNGFRVKPNASDLASSILNLLTDRDLRERMSKNAKNYSSRYDWNRVIPTLERVYIDASRREMS